ncbi:MAG TPA: hypothetical protein VGE67_05585 [Haloferula sp.]
MKISPLQFLALACAALVGTIEVLNYQAGDGIGQKTQYEPHSKWRLASQASERKVTEMKFRDGKEIPGEQSLTPEQASEVERIAQASWAKSLPHNRLARAMNNYSVWGAPLGLLTFVCGILLRRGVPLRATCSSIGAITLLITLVRYIPSLGW